MSSKNKKIFIAVCVVAVVVFIAGLIAIDNYMKKFEVEPTHSIGQPIANVTVLYKRDEVVDVGVIYEDVVEYAPEIEPPKTFTDDEILLIERVVQAEAGGEPLVGKVAVAATIMNRAECRGMTIEQVVYEPNQYAQPTSGVISNATHDAVKLAEAQRDLFPRNMVYFRRDYYHEKYGEPYVVIGKHYFSVEKKYEQKSDE